jgi:hypothetical protein
MFSGAMDAQDLLIWGKARPDMIWNEEGRIQELCKWGEQFKLDGFVRYRFHYFRSLDVFTHGALPPGWKWTCEQHHSRVSSRLADL